METPDEDALREDFVSPMDLSDEQREALELFSEMDLSRVSEMGRQVAERPAFDADLEAPTLSESSAPAEQAADEIQPPVLDLPQPESAPEPEPEPPATPEPGVVQTFEPPVEPVSEPVVQAEEPVVPESVEPEAPAPLVFMVDEAPEPPKAPEAAPEPVEVPEPEPEPTEAYELTEALPAINVTEHAEQATDEEFQDVLEPPVEVPAFPEEQPVAAENLPEPEKPEVVPEPEPVLEVLPEPPPEPVVQPVSEEVLPEPPAVEPEPVEIESVEIPASTAMSDLQADELFDEIERELETEQVAPEAAIPVGDGAPQDVSEPEVQPASFAESTVSGRDKLKSEEEFVVSEDQKKKKKEQKPDEDIFEVYDLEEETEEAEKPAAAEAEEEIVELEEVTEASAGMADIEKSVDEEMADIFGDEAETPPAKKAPVVQGAEAAPADDFDLSIFKESAEAPQEVASLQEVDLSSMTEEAPSSAFEDIGHVTSATPSRIDAITAEKGPSTLPMTIAVVVSFTALLLAGMLIVALKIGRVPWG